MSAAGNRAKWSGAAAAAALVALAGMVAPVQAGPVLQLAGVYFAGLGVGAVFFVAVLTVARAAWHAPFQAVPLRLAGCFPTAAVLLLGVVLAYPETYPWATQPEPGLRGQWLSRDFFAVRSAVYLAVWILSARFLARWPGSVPVAAAVLVVLAPTAWLAAGDWLMSLTPAWASTIFGLYVFLGFAASTLAALAIAACAARIAVGRSSAVSSAQIADLAGLLFAVTALWAYTWYCQYMLTWYTNHPHEVGYFAARVDGNWRWPFFGAVVLGWALPFVVLLSRVARRRAGVVLVAAASGLAGHWLDLYAMIGPVVGNGRPGAGLPALVFTAIGAAWCGWLLCDRGRASRDPVGNKADVTLSYRARGAPVTRADEPRRSRQPGAEGL